MIDPDSITDEMRRAAEPLYEGGQFSVYEAYQRVGARILDGDPRLDRLVSGPAGPVDSVATAAETKAPTTAQVRDEVLSSIREQHRVQFGEPTQHTSYTQYPTVVHAQNLRNRR